MTGDRSQLTNFVNKYLGTVKFDNDHVAKIMGYGDYQIGNVTISRVYFVEGHRHNLFFVGQFCDSDLEVAFRQHTCFIRNLEGVDLLTESQGNNLYTLSFRDMMASSPICLLSKASKTKSWLWHRRLSHLNFGAINHLDKQGLVWGLPKLKFKKDHLCFACAMGKSKKKSHKPKSKDTNQEKLYLMHMDLYGPICVKSVNGKKYILVIVDDYSRFTWVKCLSVDHPAPEVIAPIPEVVTPEPAASTSLPSSTTVDQDTPSSSNSQSTPKTQPPIILNDVEEDNHDIEVAHMGNDLLEAIRIFLAYAAQINMVVYQMDVKTVFLNASRPDQQFDICMCARYQAWPTKKHLHAVKRIFWCLRGIVNRGLWYSKDSLIALTAFADANHDGCQDTHCSTSDSLSKHIDIRYHFIKEHVENGVIELYFVNTEYQLAGIFTKALGRERIEFLINKLGMRSFTPETLKQLTDKVDE
nr:putative ribonuclease H-like domain-containing protein [Tanacetum cinerariifolium]